jgi:Ca2+-transporting ATPase
VILDDDFSSIVQWVRMGRKIFDNLKKAMVYIVGVHVPIAWLGLIPVLLWWPIMLYPIHIVFLELLIDPSCSVVFESEKEEENIMKQKPRSSKEHLLWKRTIFVSLVQWFFSLVMVIAILKFALSMWWTDQVARTMTFATLIIGNISLILVNRSWSKNMFAMLKVKNPALLPVIIWALVFLLWAIYIPWLQKIFNFANITAIQLIIAISAGLISVIRFEWVKKVFQTKHIALLKD